MHKIRKIRSIHKMYKIRNMRTTPAAPFATLQPIPRAPAMLCLPPCGEPTKRAARDAYDNVHLRFGKTFKHHTTI